MPLEPNHPISISMNCASSVTGKLKYGAIDTIDELLQNLKTHCIPESIFESGVSGYDDFLIERRKLMVEKMKNTTTLCSKWYLN